MNKTVMLALALVLFVVGTFVGNKIGSRDWEQLSIKSGTAVHEEPTASSSRKIIAQNMEAVVLERVTYGAPTIVYLNDDLTVTADNGETYRLKQGSFFKFVGVNEAEDRVTVFVDTKEEQNLQLELPKQKVYPVDEGEWTRVRDKSFGDKWVRTKSSWYDNI